MALNISVTCELYPHVNIRARPKSGSAARRSNGQKMVEGNEGDPECCPECFLKRLKGFLDFFSVPEVSLLGRGIEDAAVKVFSGWPWRP
jgi:hypothetical protein